MIYYCSKCKKPYPEIVELDYGYGITEYWGATSCHTNVQEVSKCCEGELLSKEELDELYGVCSGDE